MAIAALSLACALPQALGQAPTPTLSASFSVERRNLYVNEEFTLTLQIRSAGVQLGGNITLTGMPDKKQLALDKEEEVPVHREIKENRIHELRGYRFPARVTAPGSLSLEPVLDVYIRTVQRSFFGNRYVDTAHQIHVEPLTLTVQPLPETGRPADFTGAIGQFEFEVIPEPTRLAVGELITVTFSITGKGYTENIPPPRISQERHVRIYDPKPVATDNRHNRRFEQVVIPQSTNISHLSAVSFSYFDPRAQAYVTLQRGPFPLTFYTPQKAVSGQYRAPEPRPGKQADASADITGLKPVVAASPDTAARLEQARQAYEDRHYPAAVEIFSEILETHGESATIRHNLGQACFRMNLFGQAVFHYRRATRLAPRDADIRQNLARAMRQAGARPMRPGRFARVAEYFTLREWGWIAGSSAAILLLFVILLYAGGQRARAATVLISSLILLAAGGYAILRHHTELEKEAVLTGPESARLAPGPSAEKSFDLPEGSIVHIVETSGTWSKISAGEKMGWIPAKELLIMSNRKRKETT